MSHAMDQALEQLAEVINHQRSRLTLSAEEVSEWSVAQQLEHTLHAARGCLIASMKLAERKDRGPLPDTSPIAQKILSKRVIAKGTGNAPDRTLPKPAPDHNHLETLLIAVQNNWSKVKELNLTESSAALDHHVLGPLTASQWVDFAAIHSEHHLGIIESIIASHPVAP